MQPDDDQATVGFTVPPGLSALTVRYDVLAEIGRGGMGIVYKARDRQTGDLVALKILHPSAASDPQALERFKNELILARRITHKNVCRVYDLNEYAGTTVISMEFLDGRSLRAILREVESVSVRQGLKMLRQITAGLAEAHSQGVVHRDLKPENILIGRDGAVKIMDFGIARLADSRVTATGQFVGTPAYMSPEQAEGKPADARSDIYSLGLVMYEMFCGRPAFSGDTPIAVVAKQVAETPTAPRAIESDLPVRIDEAIRKCLEKSPARRFQSVADLDAALSADTGASVETPPPDMAALPHRAARWEKIDWGLLVAAAAGLVLFVPAFARVSLAPRSEVTFDRTVLRRIAEEHLQRLGAQVTPVKQIGTDIDPGLYVYLASKNGAASARDAANNPVHYWTWHVTFEGASVHVDNRGRLTSFTRDTVPVDMNAGSFDDAKRQAAKAVEDFFGHPTSTLEPENETRGQVYGFAWLGPSDGVVRERYSVDIDKLGVSSLGAAPQVPPGYSMEFFPFGEVTMNEWGMPVAVGIGVLVCAFGFLNRRRVVAVAPWRTAIVIVAFIVGASQSATSMVFFGVGELVSVGLALGVLFALVAYLGSVALEVLLKKGNAWKLDTVAALFSTRNRKAGAGLSIVRGSAIGLLLLGVDTLAIWIGTTNFGGRLSLIHIGLLGGIVNGFRWPLALILGVSVVQMIGLTLLVAFADSVTNRLPLHPWLRAIAAAAFLAATGIRFSMATVQPWSFIALILFVDYGLLLVAFRRFDLLTLSAAIGTFALWWAAYPLLIMQKPIGAAAPWIAFVIWGLIVVAAAGAAFQSDLLRRYRRLASAFD
jgi:Protein kinase domain